MIILSSVRTPFFIVASLVFIGGIGGSPRTAHAAMSFCNRTSGALEAALGYRGEGDDKAENWVSEGWWQIEPGQCARVYAQALSQRFYYYYARTLTQGSKPTIWAGKYVFCTEADKAFRIEGDGDCAARKYQSTGFQDLDIGANTHDYTLDFKDGTTR
jgi:uncharacterized membrane protein